MTNHKQLLLPTVIEESKDNIDDADLMGLGANQDLGDIFKDIQAADAKQEELLRKSSRRRPH